MAPRLAKLLLLWPVLVLVLMLVLMLMLMPMPMLPLLAEGGVSRLLG